MGRIFSLGLVVIAIFSKIKGVKMSSYMRTMRRRIVCETPGRAFIRDGGDYHSNGRRQKPKKSKGSKFRGTKQ